MKSFTIFIMLLCLGLGAITTHAFILIKNKKLTGGGSPGKGFAVVELFTSEGCSSCPPADALVARLEKESAEKPVYILAFHVDYWDRLGWKDAFSSTDFTKRQNQYAHWLKLSSVYTPQVVVNGHTELVGSEESALRKAIKIGLDKPAKTELALSNVKVEREKASLQYRTDGNVINANLLLALVEKNVTTKVQRGENGGRTLSHVQIVTQLKSLSIKNSGGAENITLPHGFDPQKYELIGFVQNSLTGEIAGATKAEFPPANIAAAK